MKCPKCDAKMKFIGNFDEWRDNIIRGRYKCNKCNHIKHVPEVWRFPQ